MRRGFTLDGRRRSDVAARSGRDAFFCNLRVEDTTRTVVRTSPATLALRDRPPFVPPSVGVHVEKVRPKKNRALSRREKKAARRARQQANAEAARRSLVLRRTGGVDA